MRVRGKHTFDIAPEIQGTTDKFVAVKSTTTAPTVNDDNTQGYYVGYKWVNTTTDTTYHCEDDTTGAAVWTAGGGTDANAIHDNVSGEINAITEKVSPVSADLLLIEDSAATNSKKKVQVGNLPFNNKTVATDVIWDAAGDLVYGTGADTASRLPAGTGLQQLRMNAGATAPEWFTPAWQPPAMSAGDLLTSGATFTLSSEGGFHVLFDADGESIYLQLVLDNNGKSYDGSNLAIRMWGRVPTTPSGGDLIAFITKYAFSTDGGATGGTLTTGSQQQVSVGGITADTLFDITLDTMTGVANAKTLRVQVEFDTAGLAPNSYGIFEMISFELIKV